MASANSASGAIDTGQLAGQLAARGPIGGRFFDALKAVSERLWPVNTPTEVAIVTGYSISNAERILSRKRRISAEHALRLVTSGADDGLIIETYIESFPPEQRQRAWDALRAAVRRVDLRDSLQRQRAELDRLELQIVQPSKSRR